MSVSTEEIEKVVFAEDDFGHEMRVGSVLKPENVKTPPFGNLLTRFPEPATLALAGLGGLAALLAARHRK
jgi:hypothetical protein